MLTTSPEGEWQQVTLSGTVHSWSEQEEVARQPWSVSGGIWVDNRITIATQNRGWGKAHDGCATHAPIVSYCVGTGRPVGSRRLRRTHRLNGCASRCPNDRAPPACPTGTICRSQVTTNEDETHLSAADLPSPSRNGVGVTFDFVESQAGTIYASTLEMNRAPKYSKRRIRENAAAFDQVAGVAPTVRARDEL
jgi:hypothetical protein